MHAASTRTAQQRRLAAQSLIATRDRLASIPSTLEVAPVVTPSNATIENLTVALESLLAAIRPAAPAPVIVPAPTPVAVDPQARPPCSVGGSPAGHSRRRGPCSCTCEGLPRRRRSR